MYDENAHLVAGVGVRGHQIQRQRIALAHGHIRPVAYQHPVVVKGVGRQRRRRHERRRSPRHLCAIGVRAHAHALARSRTHARVSVSEDVSARTVRAASVLLACFARAATFILKHSGGDRHVRRSLFSLTAVALS